LIDRHLKIKIVQAFFCNFGQGLLGLLQFRTGLVEKRKEERFPLFHRPGWRLSNQLSRLQD